MRSRGRETKREREAETDMAQRERFLVFHALDLSALKCVE